MEARKIEYHPACLLLPRMSQEEFTALCESMKSGFDARHPILLADGMILDGRHRYEAAIEVGVEPQFIHFAGGDPYGFVRREHEARRSWLSGVQKAAVLMDLDEKSESWKAQQAAIKAEGDRKRSEAAKAQPRTDDGSRLAEKQVVDDSSQPPAQKKEAKTRKAKAERLGVNQTDVAVAEFIKKNDPDLFEQMKAGEVPAKTAQGQIKKAKRAAEIAAIEEKIQSEGLTPPDGLFDVIAIDPPWNYGREYDPDTSRIANPYPEMTQAELLQIELPAKDDAVLFLWTTHAFIWDAKALMDKWGFAYKATLVWDKQKLGMGHWLRMQCEFCLVGIKGNPAFDNQTERDIISEPRREHSRKPEAFYTLVEKVTVGRRLDYFARAPREGWVTYGAEDNKYELAG